MFSLIEYAKIGLLYFFNRYKRFIHNNWDYLQYRTQVCIFRSARVQFLFDVIFYNYLAQPAAGRDSVALEIAAGQQNICSQKE